MARAMREGKPREGRLERAHHALVRDPAKREHDLEPRQA